MSQLVANCPRCSAKKIAFEVKASSVTEQVGWENRWEAFCICGHCNQATIFRLSPRGYEEGRAINETGGLLKLAGSINNWVDVNGYVSISDAAAKPAPEYLPENILAAFNEGAKCLAINCFNAAGTMFRLCVDMTTKDKLPKEDLQGLNYKTRRDLGLRLPWLFDNGILPQDLRELSHAVKEDGNDGAHQGTLSQADALDLLDFTSELLERIYTHPQKLKLAAERRAQRRSL